ncbi:MAG TPA: DinB family protein [Gemmatimonadales bacterium]|nr:DinB family protein [Gemmatimonadales bacterium]
MTRQLLKLLRYDTWANRETLRSLGGNPAPPRSVRWMAHIVGAELLWLARLRDEPPAMPVWPELDVKGCGDGLNELARQWADYLRADLSLRLSDNISYTNSKGEAWTSTVEDILIHVTIHSAYHRGQIASDLRSAGAEPAYTDYIHAVRRRLIE